MSEIEHNKKIPMTKAQYNKRYYEKNKEVRVQKANEKINCYKCSRQVMRSNMSKHRLTSRCQKTYEFNQIISFIVVGDLNKVKELVENSEFDILKVDTQEAFECASRFGKLDILKYLLEKAKYQDHKLINVAHLALDHKHHHVVKYITDIIKREYLNQMFRFYTINNNVELVRYLHQQRNYNFVKSCSLYSACEIGSLPVIKFLCEETTVDVHNNEENYVFVKVIPEYRIDIFKYFFDNYFTPFVLRDKVFDMNDGYHNEIADYLTEEGYLELTDFNFYIWKVDLSYLETLPNTECCVCLETTNCKVLKCSDKHFFCEECLKNCTPSKCPLCRAVF